MATKEIEEAGIDAELMIQDREKYREAIRVFEGFQDKVTRIG